jgi:hypothetical protein
MDASSLEFAKSIYGSWAALSRAGIYVEIMESYIKGEIILDVEDFRELKRIHFLYDSDHLGWAQIVKRYNNGLDNKICHK